MFPLRIENSAGNIYFPELSGRMLPPPPPGYRWVRVLHDDEKQDKFRNGLPETVDLVDSHDVVLTEAWQRYLFDSMWRKVPSWTRNQVVQAWASYTADGRCYTDHSAVQNGRADYIQGVNLDAGGIGWKTLTTGGNIHLVKDGPVSQGGEKSYPVVTWDGNKPLGKLLNISNDYVTILADFINGVATTRTKIVLPDGRHRVDPFPQLGGADVPALFISKRPNFIRARHIIFIDEWESPYVPPR